MRKQRRLGLSRRLLTHAKNHREKHGLVSDAPIANGGSSGTRSGLRGAFAETDSQCLFPFTGRFFLDHSNRELSAGDIQRALSPQLSKERLRKLRSAVSARTFSVQPLLFGAYDLGNVSAIARSAEAFGFGEMSVVAQRGATYKQSGRTSSGASKWLHINWFEKCDSAFSALRQRGYQRILVADATPENNPTLLHDVDFTIPTVLCLGNEREGIPQKDVDRADGCVAIDMRGLVESLNVSVAGAVFLYTAFRNREANLEHGSGDLGDKEKSILEAVMMLRAVQGASRKAGGAFLEELVKREEHLRQKEPEEFQGARHKLKTTI
jgi:tRNA (guanosine-2'-O-)-methyltransferase